MDVVRRRDRVWRALTAPGATARVAAEGSRAVGFVQLQSDGVIQAHLFAITVRADQRGRGIGRRFVQEAFMAAGGQHLDLVTGEAVAFYRTSKHKELNGFRIYIDKRALNRRQRLPRPVGTTRGAAGRPRAGRGAAPDARRPLPDSQADWQARRSEVCRKQGRPAEGEAVA